MQSITDLYAAFNGPAEIGRIIGVSTEHAAAMRRRGSIPIEHWEPLIKAAQDRDVVGLDHVSLTRIHVEEKRARRDRRPLPEVPAGPDLRTAGAAA